MRFVTIVFAVLIFSFPCHGVTYTVTEIGEPGIGHSWPFGVNDNGQVVGLIIHPDDSRQAFLYDNGVMIDLGTLGGNETQANDINNSGQIVGYSFTAEGKKRAFLYENGVMIGLGALAGQDESEATGINNSGHIAGNSFQRGPSYYDRAFLYANGAMHDIGHLGAHISWAYDINDHAQIAGGSYKNTNGLYSTHAFIYDSGSMTALGTLGGDRDSYATALNNVGQAAGISEDPQNNDIIRSFLYEKGVMTDLGTLGGNSRVKAINDSGQIVGYSQKIVRGGLHAFLYEGGVMHSLTELVNSNSDSGWSFGIAYDINSHGQIVGIGFNGQHTGFLLTPVYAHEAIAVWKLDEDSGDTAYDSAGSNDGTLIGNPIWTSGMINGGLEFDGIDDHVEISGYKGIVGKASRTCAAWIKTTGTGAIVSWGDSDISGGWWLFRVEAAGRIRLQSQGGAIVGSTDLRDDTWYHVAAVLDSDGAPNNSEIKLYVNGVEEAYSEIGSQPINTSSHSNVTIGASSLYDGTVVVPFTGLIDDVWIYERALSTEEVMQLYQDGNKPPIADAGEDVEVPADEDCGAIVTLDGSGSSDEDEDELSYYWYYEDELFAEGETAEATLGLGSHVFTLIVNDGTEDSAPDDVVITVVDRTGPEFSVVMDPSELWPPNHNMVEVEPAFTVSDNCSDDITIELVDITSNESDEANTFDPNYDNTLDDGYTIDDIQVDTDGTIYLRAERSGEGDGRVYILTYRALDQADNESLARASVFVPHDQGQHYQGKPGDRNNDLFIDYLDLAALGIQTKGGPLSDLLEALVLLAEHWLE